MTLPYPFKSTRYWLLFIHITLNIGVSLITRVTLFAKSITKTDFSFLQMAGAFSFGFFFDLVESIYFIVPSLLYLWVLTEKLFQPILHLKIT